MKKLLFFLPLLFIFFVILSCSSDDNDSNSDKETSLYYGFSVSSVSNYPNDATEEEKRVEIDIDGVIHTDIAPFTWVYKKNTILNKTHIKVKINSNRNTNVSYELRKNKRFNEKNYEIDPGKLVLIDQFKDKLDTIIKFK